MFFAFGFFDVHRFCDDAEEASLKMPWRPTAAIETGARGLAERVSTSPFGSCMFFAHRRQLTSGCRRVYGLACLAAASAAAGTGACMSSLLRDRWYLLVYSVTLSYHLTLECLDKLPFSPSLLFSDRGKVSACHHFVCVSLQILHEIHGSARLNSRMSFYFSNVILHRTLECHCTPNRQKSPAKNVDS